MPRVELPDGNWAELRDPDDVRRSDQRAALKSADAEGSINLLSNKFGLDGMAAIQDALMVRFIRRWSLVNGDGETPLPVTLEAVQDLRMSYYQPLAAVVAPAIQQVMGGEEQKDPLSVEPSSASEPTG